MIKALKPFTMQIYPKTHSLNEVKENSRKKIQLSLIKKQLIYFAVLLFGYLSCFVKIIPVDDMPLDAFPTVNIQKTSAAPDILRFVILK